MCVIILFQFLVYFCTIYIFIIVCVLLPKLEPLAGITYYKWFNGVCGNFAQYETDCKKSVSAFHCSCSVCAAWCTWLHFSNDVTQPTSCWCIIKINCTLNLNKSLSQRARAVYEKVLQLNKVKPITNITNWVIDIFIVLSSQKLFYHRTLNFNIVATVWSI